MNEQEQSAPATTTSNATPPAGPIESPPPAPMPVREDLPDPRVRLLQLASELMRSSNKRLVVEYLRLRRAIA